MSTLNYTLPANIPSPIGSIEAYIHAVNTYPILTEESELNYAQQYKETGDLSSAGALVMSHLRLVVSVARGYLGYGLPHADLIQEGNVGLMKAVKRFDPERGVRLVSFALHWIKAEIHDYILRNWRIVKIATTKSQRKLFFNLRRMKGDKSTLSAEDIREMSDELSVKESDVRSMELRMSAGELSLEPSNGDEDGVSQPIDYLEAENSDPRIVLEGLDHDYQSGNALTNVLENMDERSRHIIASRWLNEENKTTLTELAETYGVSAERIRQIEVAALKNMRKAFEAKGLTLDALNI